MRALLQRLDRRVAVDAGGDRLHLDRALHDGGNSGGGEKVAQAEGVHHGREHAHIVGVDPVHAAGTAHHAAPDVAGADHERDFDALVHDFLDLPDHLADGFGIVAVILRALERLAADLEQHPVEAEFLIHAVTLSAKLNCTRFEYTMKSPISPRKTAIAACFYRKNVYITP